MAEMTSRRSPTAPPVPPSAAPSSTSLSASAPTPPAGPDAYDPVADVYDRFWGDALAPSMLDALDRVLPAGGSVAPSEGAPPPRLLDLCCGTGQLAQGLAARGWHVVGLDGSPAMLDRARRRAPSIAFAQADARAFDAAALAGGVPFDAVVCAFDSLNHLPDAAALADAFACVHRALRPGGRFVFDVNVREGFEERFQGSLGFAEDDLVCVVRAAFDGTYGRYDLTILRADTPSEPPGAPAAPDTAPWRRSDVTLVQRCFEVPEILAALDAAGFSAPTVLDAEADLDMAGHIGRAVFVVDRPLA